MPIKLQSSGGGAVTIDVPSTASTYTLTAPAETAAIITSVSASGINASALSAGTIPRARMFAGCIFQVQQTWWNGAATLAAGSFTNHPNLSVAITPTSATSKILVMVSMQAVVYNVTMQARFTRNDTPIGIAAAAGSRVLSTFGGLQTIGDGNHQFTPWNYQYLDSPATTSALTYRIQLKMQSSATAYLNRSVNDADNSDWAQRTTSSITVMEVAA
jgi:hypothetical protein